MKTTSQLCKYFNLLLVLLIALSCNKNEDTITNEKNDIEETKEIVLPTIVELTQQVEELSLLKEVLESVDSSILERLTSSSSKTVFAPTNDAFISLFSQLEGYDSLKDFVTEEEKFLLGELLKYHIIYNEAILSKDLVDDMVIKTLLVEDITIRAGVSIYIEDITDLEAKIIKSDNLASDGVVHMIDKILLPQIVINHFFAKKSILEIVNENEELSLFKAVLEKAGLGNQFNTSENYTVFAPNNTAIQELFNLLGENYNNFDDFNSLIEIEILKRILLYHIIAQPIRSGELNEGILPTLLDGDSIAVIPFEDSFQLGDASNLNANFLSIDNEASNGVIHIIDKILIPAEIQEYLNSINTVSDKTISEVVMENEEFSFLKEALSITGLLDILDQNGSFTVFAPTNESFNVLFALLDKTISSIEDIDTELEINMLRDVLTYHVLNEQLPFEKLTEGEQVTLSKDNIITFKQKESSFELIDATTLGANIVLKDIFAKNGIIHTIDRILLPQSVIDDLSTEVNKTFAQALYNIENCEDAYSLFVSMGNSLNSALQGEFTFFIPSNAAFTSFFNSIEGYNSLEDFTSAEGIHILKTILKYHCIETGKILISDLFKGQVLTTAQGEKISIEITNNKLILLDKTSRNIKITSSNNVLKGIVHIVDEVLIPQEVLNRL